MTKGSTNITIKALAVALLILFALSLIPFLSFFFLIGVFVISIITLVLLALQKRGVIDGVIILIMALLGFIPLLGYVFRVVGIIFAVKLLAS